VIPPGLVNLQVLNFRVTLLFQGHHEFLAGQGCHPDQVFQHFLAFHCLLLDPLVLGRLVFLEILLDRMVLVVQLDRWVQMDRQVLTIQVHQMDLTDLWGQPGLQDQVLLLNPADLMVLVDLLVLVILPDPLVQCHHEDQKDQAVLLSH
jgi:hypothetical protein